MELLRGADGLAELVLVSAALDVAARRRLKELTGTLAAAADLRVLLVRAEGLAFCVGGDVQEMAGATDRASHVAVMADALHQAIS